MFSRAQAKVIFCSIRNWLEHLLSSFLTVNSSLRSLISEHMTVFQPKRQLSILLSELVQKTNQNPLNKHSTTILKFNRFSICSLLYALLYNLKNFSCQIFVEEFLEVLYTSILKYVLNELNQLLDTIKERYFFLGFELDVRTCLQKRTTLRRVFSLRFSSLISSIVLSINFLQLASELTNLYKFIYFLSSVIYYTKFHFCIFCRLIR